MSGRLKKGYEIFLCLLLCVLQAGCGGVEQTESGGGKEPQIGREEQSDGGGEELPPEQIDAYGQILLYLQEGFRRYGVEGAYLAYFAPVEKMEETYRCDILLKGEDGLWQESIAYSYDEENDWYSFEGQYEPVLTGDPFWSISEKSDFVKDMWENSVYQAEISMRQDIALSVRYFSEGGPVESDYQKSVPYAEIAESYLRSHAYVYQDDRMDVRIAIDYPQVYLKDDGLEKRINEKLREAFFYGYDYEEETNLLTPQKEMYGTIDRTYIVTRADEEYLSLRIFEDNCFRGANHPNEWETGITICMRTGETLSLQDVTGEGQTPLSLLDSGAFECLWYWENDTTEDWISELRWKWEDFDYTLSDLNDSFYLTEDSLGLITSVSRYYTVMEAKFEDLGLSAYCSL